MKKPSDDICIIQKFRVRNFWIIQISSDGITSVDEETFRRYLYYPEVPDPDLVIRTAGEFRVSNFLLWEIAYSEFLILDKEWPDFTKEDLINAIKWFNKRERRFGGIET